MAKVQRQTPPWAQTTIGLSMAMLGACAPPPEHELVPSLGSGPPLADTGDSPADDPEADDADAPEDDTTSSGGESESGGDASGTSESGEACRPADEGCACTLDGTCGEGLSCVDDICEPCEGCQGRRDPCAAADTRDGAYCGATIGGDAQTLYRCAGGATTSSTPCAHGCSACDEPEPDTCKAHAGQPDADACDGDDPCAAGMYGDGPYCGESIGGAVDTLYLCAGGATTATSACDFGCAQCDPFEADVCKSFAGQQDGEACE